LLSTIRPERQEASSLNKSGMYLEPLPFRLYYPALNQLNLYHETYHIDELAGQAYIQYVITPVSRDSTQILRSFKKLKKEPVNANIFQLDISSLISGHYILEANVFDGNKNLKASSMTTFSRLNPTGDSIYLETAALNANVSFVKTIPSDSLEYYMRAMAPIISSIDNDVMNMLLKKGSEKAKRYFIHRYWTSQAGKHADLAFSSYMNVAKIVDDQFRSGFGYGFETDRGHVFLKYGTPDDRISEESEPSAPPYEIWFYNEFPATHQTNVRFLFYNPSLSHNAYKLLHSTAIGEVYNSRWELELYRDATLETPGVNVKAMGENVNRNARRYFEN
jgi:GWxTD domain-containing protein